MNLRKTVSLVAALTFPIVIATSVILYLMPHGRVAYWADWHYLGLGKDQWGALHINAGLLFLAALLPHTWYNWGSIVSYLRAKMRAALSADLLVAGALTLFCVAGTVTDVPPFSTLGEFGESIKDSASRKHGEPPYGHAELSSLKVFARRTELDLPAAIAALEAEGFHTAGGDATLKGIAAQKGVSAQRVFEIIRGASGGAKGASAILPAEPAPGLGKLTLADFCAKHSLSAEVVLAGLKAANLPAAPDLTIKAIGDAAGIAPSEVYGKIRDLPGIRP